MEELIVYLYKQGVQPNEIKIENKNDIDPFLETCKKLANKYHISQPILAREHIKVSNDDTFIFLLNLFFFAFIV
ncbi:MAG: hypothetical protein PHR47_00865 [Candidatus Pacebacteria bacterium]|nr:hypothetical protein [Candidatus Paceibacterota bacterium]